MTMMSEVAESYSLEELLPLVSDLAEQYTKKKSTSVSYECANMLMEAVLFTIAHYSEGGLLPVSATKVPVEEAYRIGFENLVKKVRFSLLQSIQLQNNFDDYGNRALKESIMYGLPEFFKNYNYRFHPTDHIILMDYPIIGLDMKKDGIDLISDYIEAIIDEQEYLSQFPREEVIDTLQHYNVHYRSDIINIREIFDLQRAKK